MATLDQRSVATTEVPKISALSAATGGAARKIASRGSGWSGSPATGFLTGFEADSFSARRMLPQSRGDGFRRRRHAAAPYQLVVLVDHCDRCFLERHVETDIMLQFGHQ